MTYTRSQALTRALARIGDAFPVGQCWIFTRGIFGRGPIGDYDRDGRADAEDAWKAARHRHPGNRTPPPGVPCYWTGGSRDDGHGAVSAGGGKIVSTDAPEGRIGLVDLAYPERQWGLTYLGWTEDIYGDLIPDDYTPPTRKPRRPKPVRDAIKATKAALAKATGPVQRARLRAALAKLRKVNKR